MRLRFLALIWLPLAAAPALAAPSDSPYLEELTWPEVASRMTTGTRTILIPSGGTEQNGPHLVIGKHNVIMRRNAGEIARQLGNALVAPVLGYVPEGSVSPPQGHMRFPGTISVKEEHFSAILEDAARSFKQHGFTLICLIGDSGGNQAAQAAVAKKLSQEWVGDGVRVVQVNSYYDGKEAQGWAGREKLGGSHPEAHGGFMDTAELMAAQPEGVRREAISDYQAKDHATTGVEGDPSAATQSYGEKLLALRVSAAVQQIRAMQDSKP